MRNRLWRQVEQCPVLVALEELIEALHETLHGNRLGLADTVDAGADQGQAAVKDAGVGRSPGERILPHNGKPGGGIVH